MQLLKRKRDAGMGRRGEGEKVQVARSREDLSDAQLIDMIAEAGPDPEQPLTVSALEALAEDHDVLWAAEILERRLAARTLPNADLRFANEGGAR